jgi:hypothetical protein
MVSSPKFTQGPWTLESGTSGTYEKGDDERHPLVTGPNRENPICLFQGDWSDEWANARLVATAPELFDALRDVLAHIAKEHACNGQRRGGHAIFAHAQAILARAAAEEESDA